MGGQPSTAVGVAPATSLGVSRRLVFCIVAIAILMSTIDSTIVATALPTIHRSLHATINWAGWTITIYSLGMVIVLPVAGKLSDQFGRRRVFLVGVVLFTLSSLVGGLSTNIYMLIGFRALQAVGGGALQPSAAGVVADHFGKDRDKAIGLFGTVASSGQIIGPVLGGLLVGYLTWRWIFFVNVPIGAVLVLGILKCVPESHRAQRGRIDGRGLILLAAFVLLANFGITSIGNARTMLYDPSFLAPLVAAVLLLLAFAVHTRRSAAPFIPMRLLRARGFAVMNVQNLLWGVAGFGVATLAPLYAEQRYSLAALSAGTLLTARGIGAVAVGAAAAMALRRTGYRIPLAVGFTVTAVGTVLMAVSPGLGLAPYAWLSIAAGITGLGNGMANPASRNACLQVAPDEVAAITGLRQMFVYIGIIFSVSMVTAILNRSPDPGLAQARILWVIAGVIVLLMVPLVARVPEHKGSW